MTLRPIRWFTRFWGCPSCGQVNSDEYPTCGACHAPRG